MGKGGADGCDSWASFWSPQLYAVVSEEAVLTRNVPELPAKGLKRSLSDGNDKILAGSVGSWHQPSRPGFLIRFCDAVSLSLSLSPFSL